MSGKEAMVFVVRSAGETRCAKVYKEADRRSFRQAVDYTDNRKTKNSRHAGADGQVNVELPQGVDAGGNNHAPAILGRGVSNLRTSFGRFPPEVLATNYGDEIWASYQAGTLTPATTLTGRYVREEKAVDLDGVVREIGDAERDEAARLMRKEIRRADVIS